MRYRLDFDEKVLESFEERRKQDLSFLLRELSDCRKDHKREGRQAERPAEAFCSDAART